MDINGVVIGAVFIVAVILGGVLYATVCRDRARNGDDETSTLIGE